MEKLQPAGLLTQIWTSLFPKQLKVEVRTQTLPDGNVEIIPVYTIDGKRVPSELIDVSEHQSILGHNVVATKGVTGVLLDTKGKSKRVSKAKAGHFIRNLTERGVRVRSEGKKLPQKVETVRHELRLDLSEDDTLQVSSSLVASDGSIVEKPTNLEELKRDNGWFVADGDLYEIRGPDDTKTLEMLSKREPTTLAGQDVPLFLKNADRDESVYSTIEKNERLEGLGIYGDKHENRIRVTGDSDAISLEPSLVLFGKNNQPYQATAGAIDEATGSEASGFTRTPDGWIEITSDTARGYLGAVSELRSEIGELTRIRGDAIPGTLAALLDPKGLGTPWTVYFSEQVKNSHRLIDAPADARFTLNVVESDGRALLELDTRYDHERFRLSHADVQAALSAGQQWVRRGTAWVRVDQERFNQIQAAIESSGLEPTETGARFPAVRREEVLNIFSRLGSVEHGESYAQFLQKLADFDQIEHTQLPTSLRPEIALRPYQHHGYNWLAFLRKYGLNGILADDMGLGKTLQTLSIIRMEQERSGTLLPTLIICPTSVVTNWKREAQKFFTGFEVITYLGDRRERKLQEIDHTSPNLFDSSRNSVNGQKNVIVITSFETARRDQQQLSRLPWLYVVVDEAHHIKNPVAKRTKAIKTINGQHKLALTGTPIQNNLDELWSLFDFIMPGYLGTRGRFRDQYGKGNRVDWDAVRDEQSGIKNRIHPFILRRLKEEVAKDLPEKVLIKQPIELTPLQVTLYKQTLESAEFQKLVDAVESKGVERSSTEVLAIYTRLRTICNHPALAGANPSGKPRKEESGKLDALQELMEEIKEGGHRALLFCQSTKMLDIIGDFFKKWGVEFLRLDGSTAPSVRQELVDEFNRDESLTAFLISTKAGGTGLNLTGADTVIFYDHDWNPANDNQAQDRAYRIGQTRKVTVYKLVSVGTIEEEIIKRQELKQTLADQIIGADSEGFKDLSKEQLLSLFQFRG